MWMPVRVKLGDEMWKLLPVGLVAAAIGEAVQREAKSERLDS